MASLWISWPYPQLFAGGRRESSHHEGLRGLDEAVDLSLRHRGLAAVHEVHDALSLPTVDVLEHHNGVLAGVLREDLAEVGAGGGESGKEFVMVAPTAMTARLTCRLTRRPCGP